MRRHMPNDRAHWRDYYICRFNTTGQDDALHMALWMMFLIHAFGEERAG